MPDDTISVSRGELEDEMLNISDNQPGPSRIREIVDALIAATPQDLSCGYCLNPLVGRSVCGECWRKRTSTLESAEFPERIEDQMTTETATTFRVGDRVRTKITSEIVSRLVRESVGIIFWVSAKGQEDGVSVAYPARGSETAAAGYSSTVTFESRDLELVERRWYAPPGVPMLALTLEILEALEWLRAAGERTFTDDMFNDVRTKYRHLEVTRSAIAAALAAARKEV
jgi:hypothetical protein